MAVNFDGQVVVITGAGHSLGRAYALDMGRRGAKVVVNDLFGVGGEGPTAAEKVAAEIEALGGQAVASHDTVSSPEGGQAIIDKALEAFGTVDAVVHNAGVWRHELFVDTTSDQLDPVLDVHLRGAFFVARPAWKVMQAKGYGRIVLTSSSTGCFGRVRGANYAAAKAAMLGVAKTMALEGEQYGIRANCILPIAPFGRREAPPAIFTDHLARTGLKPEETGPAHVAPIVTWLASRNCSVNGEAFSAGGGKFGKAFIAIADGWVGPTDGSVTAEDVEAHMDQIRDLSEWQIPPSSIDELAVIGELRKKRGLA